MITIQYDLGFGNNLISFPWLNLLDNKSTLAVLGEGKVGPGGDSINVDERVEFILGQGVGLFNTVDGWSGNLNSLSNTDGYWINLREALSIDPLTFEIEGNASDMYNAMNWVKWLNFGNNLISCPINPNDFDGDYDNPTYIVDSSSIHDIHTTQIVLENIADNITEGNIELGVGEEVIFLLGQGVGLFNTVDGWSGNLNNPVQGKGYWINAGGETHPGGDIQCTRGTSTSDNVNDFVCADNDDENSCENSNKTEGCYSKCFNTNDQAECDGYNRCSWDPMRSVCVDDVSDFDQPPEPCSDWDNYEGVCRSSANASQSSCDWYTVSCNWPEWYNRQLDWSPYIIEPEPPAPPGVCTDNTACNYDSTEGAESCSDCCIYSEFSSEINADIGCCNDDVVECCLDSNSTGLCDDDIIYELCDSGNENPCDGYVANYIQLTDTIDIEGCTDPDACNYNDSANVLTTCTYPTNLNYDCNGDCIAEGNNLGTENGGTGPGLDCNGVCGGFHITDSGGNCCTGPQTGCDEMCFSELVVDNCGICGGDNYECGAPDYNCVCDECLEVYPDQPCGILPDCWSPNEYCTCEDGEGAITDCNNVCNGDAVEDECGECGGDGPEPNYDCDGNCIVGEDCNGDCGGTAVEDGCGVCNGEGVGEGYCDCNTPKIPLDCWDNSNSFEEVEVQVLICPNNPFNESQNCEDYGYDTFPSYDYGCPNVDACNYEEGSDGCTVGGEFVLGGESCCVFKSMMCPDNWEGFSEDYQEYILETECTPEAPAIQVGPGRNFIGFNADSNVVIEQGTGQDNIVSLSFYAENPDENPESARLDIPVNTSIEHNSYDYNQDQILSYIPGFPPFVPPGWNNILGETFLLEPGKGYVIVLPDESPDGFIKWGVN
jgi:hypothetical protein